MTNELGIVKISDSTDGWIKVELNSATEMSFEVLIAKNYESVLRQILSVVPSILNLDADLMEAYDDAFRTKPKQSDISNVKQFLQANRLRNVNCVCFNDVGYKESNES